MKFSQAVSLLREHYPLVSMQIADDKHIGEVALLDHAAEKFPDDVLYIGNMPALLAKAPHNLICVEGALPRQAVENLVVIRPQDFASVVNRLQQEVSRPWRQESAYVKMLRMILGGKGLPYILDEAARQFGNAFVILDVSGKILARSTYFDVPDPLWITSAERGYCPPAFMEHIRAVREQKKHCRTSEAFARVCPDTGINYICSRILLGGELVGYVFMFEGGRKADRQCYEILPILSRAAGDLIRQVTSASSVQTGLYRSILSDMLQGIDPDHATARISASDLKFPAQMRVLAVRPTYYHGENYVRGKLHGQLQEIFFEAPSVYYQGGIIQIVPTDENMAISPEHLEAVRHMADSQHLLVGVSNGYVKPALFPKFYAQADEALRLAQGLSREGNIHYYSDLAFYSLLNQIPVDQHLGRFCHPALGKLRQYDEENGTELYDTLRTYTQCGFNQKLTAERMFIHRNTLNYRRERIAEVGGLDYNNPELMFLLMYSFHIDSYLQYKLD